MVWRNWLFLIVLLSLFGVLLMTFSQQYMLPLKTVKPFVIQIDEKSGLTQVVTGDDAQEYNANAELVKHFAMSYIFARENYNYLLVEEMYKKVRVLSEPKIVYPAFRAYINQLNPDSPFNRFGVNVLRSLTLQSFTVQNPNKGPREDSIVQARLIVTEASSNSAPLVYTVQITMSCGFKKGLVLDEDQRLINPLGFQVLSYTVDSFRETSPGR
jgi:type IV secretion system protein VirB8